MSHTPAIYLVSPEQMTPRTRAYLAADAARHGLFSLALIFLPSSFDPHAYEILFTVAPRALWIGALLVGAAHLTYAAIVGSETHARLALVTSAVVSLMWAVQFLLIIGAGIPILGIPILFAALAAKDLIICSGPLHEPRHLVVTVKANDEP